MDSKLKLIAKKDINKEVTTEYSEDFDLQNDGLYLIEIIARPLPLISLDVV